MADVKYTNVNWPSGSPIQGERLATNGNYTGQHKGSVTQDNASGADNDPYYVERTTIRKGTIMQDYLDENTPASGVSLVQKLTGCTSNKTDGTISKSADFSATYTAASGKALPTTITVKIGGTTATASTDYTWTKSTGALAIAKEKLTGDVEVTITAGDA